MTKRYLFGGFKYALGIGLLSFEIWTHWTPPAATSGIGVRDILAGPVQFLPLVLAAVVYTLGVLLTFVRWFVLVRAQELPFTLFNAVRLGFLGFFWSTFLPGSIGGDIFKAASIARAQTRRTVAVATVLIDRAMGLWGIIWMVALFGSVFWLSGDPVVLKPSDSYLRSIILASLIVIVVSVALWLIMGCLPAWRAERFAYRLTRIPRVGHSAAEFWRAVWMYRTKVGSIAVALVLTLCCQICFVCTIYFAAQIFQDAAHSADLPAFQEHFLLIPSGVAVQALLPTPGGMGSEEFFGWLYARVDPAMQHTGFLAAFFQRLIMWGLGLIGYYLSLRMRPTVVRATSNEADLAASPALPDAAVTADYANDNSPGPL